ncbi:hypothetical protein H3Z82_06590 [Gelidibacter gilvus]|uniref:Uncharacterized protein n=2 Tax=Gelidibacter maritimus TaxID=2761487 RepID=A0A7W2M468_9FLAO|nr:hypothetical protein [Gelidibacter maritimus]
MRFNVALNPNPSTKLVSTPASAKTGGSGALILDGLVPTVTAHDYGVKRAYPQNVWCRQYLPPKRLTILTPSNGLSGSVEIIKLKSVVPNS